MFRLQKPNYKPSRPSRDRLEFKFSNFQALQVPKGWERLFVSLISLETGKSIARLGKVFVRNGSCQWMETLSESIWISQDDSSKEYDESLVKIVVSMGSTRSSTLGEVTINLAHFAGSKVSSAVSQPLQKCSYGTILQVKIQCLTPKPKSRDDESNYSSSIEKNLNHDFASRSDESENSGDGAARPQRGQITTPDPLKSDSKGTIESADQSHSFDANERESFPGRNSFKSADYHSSEREFGDMLDNGPIPDINLFESGSPLDGALFNSRLSIQDDLKNVTSFNRSSMMNFGSSRNLLEAAEDTIQELCAEAKMWERNARKLLVDLDMSRKEFSDLSKKHADSVMELSAAHTEQDGMKREIEQLKQELQQLTTRLSIQENPTIQSGRLILIQKELENEIKYQKDVNAHLDQQMKRTQESNLELVSVLQELEDTIEQQRMEIENLSSLKSDFIDLKNSIAKSSEDNQTLLLQLKELQEAERELQSEVQLLEVTLREKSYELENERSSHSQLLFRVEKDYMYKLSVKEEKIAMLEAKLSSHVEMAHEEVVNDSSESNEELIQELGSLKEKIVELEKDCTELTDENLELLLKLKDSNKAEIRAYALFDSMSNEHPAAVSRSDESEVSDPNFHVSHLEEELQNSEKEQMQNTGFLSYQDFVEILEQFRMSFHLVLNPWSDVLADASDKHTEFPDELVDSSKEEFSAKYFLDVLLELNKLLEARIRECEEIRKNHEIEMMEKNGVIADARRRMEECFLDIEECENSKAEIEENYADRVEELDRKRSEVEFIRNNLLLKEEETVSLLSRQKEFEVEVFELQQTNSHLEEKLATELMEQIAVSICSENLQNDIKVLSERVDSHISANTILEGRLKELEIKCQELEVTLSGLRDEKMQLLESILSLEGQVRHLNDENCFLQQERDCSKSLTISLQDKIQNLKIEMEFQILDLNQQSEEMEIQWLQAQVQSEYLKAENQKLLTSAASLTDHGSILQNSHSELKKENHELHERCSELVAQLSKSKNGLSNCEEKVCLLENHLNSLLGDFSFRESSLKAEIEALVHENSNQKEKFCLEGSLHDTVLEKTLESEILQREVSNLTRQLADLQEERERISSKAADEVSRLLAEGAEFQASLQEARSNAELAKNELEAIQLESDMKVQELMGQLDSLQQDHEALTTDHERCLKLLANYKRSEEKLKTGVNDLELKLTISDYERQQLTKEMGALKLRLQNISGLEDNIASLKSEIKQCRIDKGKLELALQTVSGDYEELNKEKFSLSEKISRLLVAMSEFEECRTKRSALEEKILKMENEVAGCEILQAQNTDLENELNEVKKANMQFQQAVCTLKEEKEEWLKKAQSFEEDLKLMEKKFVAYIEVSNDTSFHDKRSLAEVLDHATNENIPEVEVAEDLNASNGNSTQRRSRFSTGQNNDAAPRKSVDSGRVVAREKYERTKSSLETELRDLRERYLEMSLKYAEVEAEREDLVMKLKSTGSGRRLFS